MNLRATLPFCILLLDAFTFVIVTPLRYGSFVNEHFASFKDQFTFKNRHFNEFHILTGKGDAVRLMY